jgi:aminopeptidase N
MPGGVEFPNMIYINPAYPELDRLIYHETAHQWLYGIIGNRTLLDGWIDEGGAEFFERGLPTGFTEVPDIPDGGYLFPLDSTWQELYADPRRAWYYAIYEQGARFYDAVLAAMGPDAFWAAMHEVYDTFAFGVVTPWDMLSIWQRHSASDLRPLFHDTFRYDWIDQLPAPGG